MNDIANQQVLSHSASALAARAALYATRYALNSVQAKSLLLDPRRADDWIALAGPWVDWPEELETRMLDHLCKEDEGAPTDIALKDLDAEGWSQLAHVFTRYYCTHRAEIAQALRDAVTTLSDRVSAQSRVAERNTDMLRRLLDLNEAEVNMLLFANLLAHFERAATFIQQLPYYGKDHACHDIALMLDVPEPDISAALRKNGPLYTYGIN
ncbi:MAG: hypothetical protein ACREXS_10685 [Gammaproteobacteria bacterium]